jgi:ATP-dependent exoDNAse (exonuclease V) alpha subunit
MNEAQLEAFNLVKSGANIFITGAAGCGKSFTLEKIINWAKNDKKYQIAVTASTGCASYLIRGRTIHSYLGIGIGKKTAKELAVFVKAKKPYIVSKLKNLDILIIDEISMINSELLDKISDFLCIINRSDKPFGGIQIILSGDYCQLPPVDGKYSFHAEIWKKANIKISTLTQQIRQNKDEEFQKMLEELRWGGCKNEIYNRLKKLRKTSFAHDITPTILYSMNIDVDKINNKKYKTLVDEGAETCVYKKKNPSTINTKAWIDSYKIPEIIELCVGAQVVLTWNISQDNGLINGSRGIVIELTSLGPKVRFLSGFEMVIDLLTIKSEECDDIWVSFIPLKLAWASTIHKCQGMTLDAVVIDLGDSIFEYGQAYTALSRARSLDSVMILDISKNSFKTHKDVLDFYRKKN